MRVNSALEAGKTFEETLVNIQLRGDSVFAAIFIDWRTVFHVEFEEVPRRAD